MTNSKKIAAMRKMSDYKKEIIAQDILDFLAPYSDDYSVVFVKDRRNDSDTIISLVSSWKGQKKECQEFLFYQIFPENGKWDCEEVILESNDLKEMIAAIKTMEGNIK